MKESLGRVRNSPTDQNWQDPVCSLYPGRVVQNLKHRCSSQQYISWSLLAALLSPLWPIVHHPPPHASACMHQFGIFFHPLVHLQLSLWTQCWRVCVNICTNFNDNMSIFASRSICQCFSSWFCSVRVSGTLTPCQIYWDFSILLAQEVVCPNKASSFFNYFQLPGSSGRVRKSKIFPDSKIFVAKISG